MISQWLQQEWRNWGPGIFPGFYGHCPWLLPQKNRSKRIPYLFNSPATCCDYLKTWNVSDSSHYSQTCFRQSLLGEWPINTHKAPISKNKFSKLMSTQFLKNQFREFVKRSSIFLLVIISSILLTFSLDYVLILLGEKLVVDTIGA